MEIFLWLSGISFLVTIFTILLFIISIPLVLVFKGVGNEKPIFTIAGIVSLIILQTTINSYINILNPYKYLGIVCLGLFFIVFLIPFVKYAFPDLSFPGRSFFIIPFRHPVDHANSLLNQHIRFQKIQLENKFIKNYMNWLGHHEFGLNHLSFKLKNLTQIYDKESTNYWLENWIHYYSYVLEFYKNNKNKNRIIFINYEKVCTLKYNYLNKLEEKLNLIIDLKNIEIFSNKKQTSKKYENELFKKAILIYEQLDSI